MQSEPRSAPHSGLGSSGSARRYSRNHFCFLFLRLLRCFSSPGSPPYPIYSGMDTRSLSVWVSPFRDPWITGYLLLPTAFRSLSRPSSPPRAQASFICPSLLSFFFRKVAFYFFLRLFLEYASARSDACAPQGEPVVFLESLFFRYSFDLLVISVLGPQLFRSNRSGYTPLSVRPLSRTWLP